jgi:hypothetical protein
VSSLFLGEPEGRNEGDSRNHDQEEEEAEPGFLSAAFSFAQNWLTDGDDLAEGPLCGADSQAQLHTMAQLQVLAGQSPEFQGDVKAAIEQFRGLEMAAIRDFIFAPPSS